MCKVIGSGVISNRFIDYSLQSKYLIYAGEVNDSSINDEELINFEENAVRVALSENLDTTFIYFSTCSIHDPEVSFTPYVQHKIRMEKLIQDSANKFLIFRLPQILGLSDTKSSLVGYLVDAVANNKPFELWNNAQKNIIDIDDVHEIVGEVLRRNECLNKVINIGSTCQTSVSQLVRHIEDFIGVSANFVLIDKGTNYSIDVSDIKPILKDLKIDFGDDYIKRSINKYFNHVVESPLFISIIVPTYNEEHGIDEFYSRTKRVLTILSPRFDHEIIFVNDFSLDNTLLKLKVLAQNDSTVKLINFSRNFGNQIAITAGIDFAQGHIAVVIDDDLQDPPEIILDFIAKWDMGYKVVYGVRPKRQGVNPFFRLAAKMYYRLIGSLSHTKIPNDTGDFRLIDRVVIDTLKGMKEENRYYRGMVAWVGFSQIGVIYERDKRFAGVSTFSFKKYLNFALNGLTSFTEKPLYFSSIVGALITSISFILAVVLIISRLIDQTTSIPGWTSLTVIVIFFGGIQLLSTGVVGIYISKIFREVKKRPLYIVESTQNIKQSNNGKQPTTI